MHAELRAALEICERDEAVRVVVLTGEGRAFSSGQDLTEDLPRDTHGRIDLGPPLARDYNPLVLKLANYPKVTVAALNGPAVGASMNIALACDVVVAARAGSPQGAFARSAPRPPATHPRVRGAALNGPAVGASMNIALACDVVVAARSAYLQEAFARIALIPDAGGTWTLPRPPGPTPAPPP